MTSMQNRYSDRMAVGFLLSETEKYSVKNDVLLSQSQEWSEDTLRNFLDGCNFKTISFFCSASISENRRHFVNNYVSEQFMNKKMSIKKRTASSPGEITPLCSSIEIYPNDPLVAPLRVAIQHITIFGSDLDTFEYVAKKLTKSPTKVTFKDYLRQQIPNGPYNRQRILEARKLADCLKSTLEGVKVVEFEVEKFKGPLMDELLGKCKMIKQLIIHSKPTKLDPPGSYVNKCFYRTYPQLTSIHWNDGVVSKKHEFAKFLDLNPNITHLKFTKNILLALDFIDDVDLERDILDIGLNSTDINNIPAICDRLKELYMKSRFKKLIIEFNDQQILIHYADAIASLPALEGLSSKGPFIPAIGRLRQLKQLTVDSLNNSTDVQPLQMLERLRVKKTTFDEIEPFINLPNLETIAIDELQGNSSYGFDHLFSYQSRREKLPGVKDLTIYLEERPYIDLKRAQIDTTIRIKRIESLDIY